MRFALPALARPLAASFAAIGIASILCNDASPTLAHAFAIQTTKTLPGISHQVPSTPMISARRRDHGDRHEAHKAVFEVAHELNARGLGTADEIATLRAIAIALNSVGDGGAYVWQRPNGRLSGLIRPTTSFKTSSGEICRHIVLRLNSGHHSREVEGIACRGPAGTWTLSG